MVERRLGQGVVQQRAQTAGNFLFLPLAGSPTHPALDTGRHPRCSWLAIRPRRPLARAPTAPVEPLRPGGRKSHHGRHCAYSGKGTTRFESALVSELTVCRSAVRVDEVTLNLDTLPSPDAASRTRPSRDVIAGSWNASVLAVPLHALGLRYDRTEATLRPLLLPAVDHHLRRPRAAGVPRPGPTIADVARQRRTHVPWGPADWRCDGRF